MSSLKVVSVATTALMIGLCAALGAQAPASRKEKDTMTEKPKIYCNIKALNPGERASHKRLTDKLIGMRKEVMETPKGYEFQYSPSDSSLAELSQWVASESRCCAFFNFHIDLERRGTLLCLRLTGEEGIKPFIVAEFQVEQK
jgi:hypothetical protein